MWIADVAPYDTIQSLWGNNIRNRVVQTFADMTEANAHLAALPTGSVMALDSTGLMYHKYANAWKPVFPFATLGATQNPGGYYIVPGQTATIFTLVVPAGYRFGLFNVMVNGSMTGGPTIYAAVAIYLDGGLIGGHQWHAPAPASATAATGYPLSGAQQNLRVDVWNNSQAGSGDLTVSGDGFWTRCPALFIP